MPEHIQFGDTINTAGQDPRGNRMITPLGGVAYNQAVPLEANEELNTDWLSVEGYGSVLYVIRSDVPSADGGVIIEYSIDGITVMPGGIAASYVFANELLQSVLVPKSNYIRIRYKNGPAKQTDFALQVKLSTTLIQPTEASINKPVSNTNLAMIVKSVSEFADSNGAFAQVARVGDAQKVHIVNSSSLASTSSTAPRSAVSSVASNAFTTIAARSDRKNMIVFNAGTGALGVYYSNAAGAARVGRIVTNGVWQMPAPIHTGAVYLKSEGTSSAEVTETV